MHLQGNLDSFPPSEILQWLAQSQKTGTLRVYDSADTKLLAFERGQLVYAVHVRQLPPLDELIVFRRLATADQVTKGQQVQALWNEVINRVQARRRHTGGRVEGDQRFGPAHRDYGRTPLGSVLIARGRLDETQLGAALDPVRMPERLLAAILRGEDLVQERQAIEARNATEGKPLYEAVIEKGLVTPEQVKDAVANMSDDSLAELLVLHGYMSRAEVRLSLDQLERFRNVDLPAIRFGEYLLAKGRISQREFECALEAQLIEPTRLGEILVEQGVLTDDEAGQLAAEIHALRIDFGLLYALREKLATQQFVSPEDFDRAVEELVGDRSLATVLVESGALPAAQMQRVLREVMTDEICDLLSWTSASFQFFEGCPLDAAFPRRDLPTVHDLRFEVQGLLLDANSTIDELQQTRFGDVSPHSVFVSARGEGEGRPAGEIYTVDLRDLLRTLDGRRPFEEVRRLLPGNRFFHACQFARLLEQGDGKLLTRRDASERGQRAVEEHRYGDAIVLFLHALSAPGNDPPETRLRVAIESARWANEKRALWRAWWALTKYARKAWGHRACRAVAARVGAMRGFGKFRSWCAAGARRLASVVPRCFAWIWFKVEEFLIRIGWAKRLWAFEARFVRPLQQALRRHAGMAAMGSILLAFLLMGITFYRDAADPSYGSRGEGPPAATGAVVSSLVSYEFDSPLETAPTIVGRDIYVVARDGVVSSLHWGGAFAERPRIAWTAKLGELGDILSRPVAAGDKLFVTNVRGTAYALATDGQVLWKTDLSRLERIAPALLFDGDALKALAVVSREKVIVLSATDGRVLYEFQTGNRIFARPVGDVETLVIGSGDNRVYRVAWTKGDLVWEHEATDDILVMERLDGVIVFATRDGGFAALDRATGERRWQRGRSRTKVRSIATAGPGRIYVEFDNGRINIYSVDTGVSLESFRPDPNLSRVTYHRRHFYFLSESGTFGQLGSRGELRWKVVTRSQNVSGWAHGDGFAALATRDGVLSLLPIQDPARETKAEERGPR